MTAHQWVQLMTTIYDHRQYGEEFPNGDIEVLMVNIVAENLLASVNEEGHRKMLLDGIIDHPPLKGAISKSEGTFKPYLGQYGRSVRQEGEKYTFVVGSDPPIGSP